MIAGAVLLLLLCVLLFAGYAAWYAKDQEKRQREKMKPPEDVLTELIMQLILKDDDAGAIAVFCAYRALTMPDKRSLAAALAAEVDRRYGTRVPWPKDLQLQAKLLLDDHYADELSRIEADIQNFKRRRSERGSRQLKEAELATKVSGW